MTNCLINGTETSSIEVFDRGLQYGDGIFETMAVCNGQIPLWESHWQRLAQGCDKLFIQIPDKDLIEKEINQINSNHTDHRYIIKLIITRGAGQRGYRFDKEQTPTRIINKYPWPDYPDSYHAEGVAVRYCDTTLSENSALAGIKHLNRLEQVLARSEWDNDEFQEGLMLTTNGNVLDGIMSNVFAVSNDKLFTPGLSLAGVSGVMRKTVIDLAKEAGIAVYEKDFTRYELEMADELFLTNSIFGIWPIRIIGKTRYTKVGGITKLLQEEVKKLCQ